MRCRRPGSHLIGRVTYESFAGAWPEREGPFAEKMNSMPKHVVTETLEELEWENSVAIKGDVPAEVERLKQGDGGPILIAGSRTLVHSLIPTGLIDEYRLMVFPVILGSGDRLFPDSPDKLALELADSKSIRERRPGQHLPAGLAPARLRRLQWPVYEKCW